MPAELAPAFDRLVFGGTLYDTAPEFIFHRFSPPACSLKGTILNSSQEQTESNSATRPVNLHNPFIE
jgi:hypothetical protein